MYIFYYQSDVTEKSVEDVKIENEKLDKLGKSNYFEEWMIRKKKLFHSYCLM